MGFNLVSQVVNLAILYVLWIVGKHSYDQYVLKREPIRIKDILSKFNLIL